MSGVVDRVTAWWQAEAPPRHAYAVSAGLALTIYFLVFGAGHVFGTSTYWDLPLTDHRAYLMGYRYFLHEPWQWPVFVTHTMNVPYTKSIAFTDSIPLWAFVNKSVATIVPPWREVSERAYLGLWYAVIFALQACFGVANLRALGHKSWGTVIVTALMFVAVPAWTLRYIHASMAAHFLTLWALYLYLRTPPGEVAPRKLRLAQIGQLAVASLVNPYHTVMSLGLFVASLARSRKLKPVAIWFPAAIVTIGVCAWAAGYFKREAKLAMFGFEVASTNVLSIVTPYRSGIIGDAAWVDPTGFQYEGVAYLGLGFLVLFALFLPRVKTLRAVIKRHPFLFAVALGAWVFALSNHIYVGSYELVAYELPSVFGWLADQFRSPGRFVWVPMYVLLVFVLKEAVARFTVGWKQLILPVVAVLQLVDASGDWRAHRGVTREPDHPRIPLAAWRPLVHAHERIYILPPYDCILDGEIDVDYVSLDIQYLASERALPINGVYSARPTRDCTVEVAMMQTQKPEDGTIYVLLRRVQEVAYRFQALGATCAEFKYGRVCSKNAAAIAELVRAGAATSFAPSPAQLAYGTRIEPGDPKSAAWVEQGWSWAESPRFTSGGAAWLVFDLIGDPPPNVALKIQAVAPLCRKRTTSDVDVLINGVLLTTLQFDEKTNDVNVVRTIPITKPELLRAPIVALELRPHDFRSPKKLRCNEDDRALGVGIQRVSFE